MLVTPAEVPTPDEPCSPAGLFPAGFFNASTVVQSTDENRSAFTTTMTSTAGSCMELLTQSAIAFATSRGAPNGQVKDMYLQRGTALADLAVSGRITYDDFKKVAPNDPGLAAAVTAREPTVVDPTLSWGVDQALTRAYQAAYALRGFGGRPALGWIEVAGEADQPHRPVNVPGTSFPQHDLTVTVPDGASYKGRTVTVRYAIFSSLPPVPVDPAQVMDWVRIRRVPVDPAPVIPDGQDLIIYIHGHSSRLEEAADLAPVLVTPPGPDPNGCLRPFAVISLDLPCNGYSQAFDHNELSPFPSQASLADVQTLANTLGQVPVPMLEFLETFLLAFVGALGQAVGQDLRPRLAAFVGGSLGGNLSLRLAERGTVPPQLDPTGAAGPLWWVGNTVAWSAAGTWTPYYDDIMRSLSLDSLSKSVRAPETTTSRAEYFTSVFDQPPVSLPDVGPDPITTAALQVAKAHLPPPQPQMWYRGGDWQVCKDGHIAGARVERQEIYNAFFRGWHWRLALEQLLFSHQYPKAMPVCAQAGARVLLGSAQLDDYDWTNIYSATHTVAGLMWANPGTTMFLANTGHSIHNERPQRLARAIQEFLPPARPGAGSAEPWTAWASLGGSVASALCVGADSDHRLEVFAVDPGGQPAQVWQVAPSGPWSGWAELAGALPGGAKLTGAPAAASNGDGRLEVFARTGTGSGADTVHTWQSAPNNGWNSWSSGLIGSPTGGPSVATKPNGLLLLAVLDQDAHVRIRGQNSLGSWWMDSRALGTQTFVGDPLVVAARDGRLEAFARAGDGSVWRAGTDAASSDNWSDWVLMGGSVAGPLDAARDRQGMLWVFAAAGDATLSALTQQDDQDHFSGWSSLGGTLKAGARPSAALNGWGGLEVFVRWSDDSVKYLRQEASTGMSWSPWFDLGGQVDGDPVVARQADGALTVLAQGTDAAVWTRSQTSCPPPPPPPPPAPAPPTRFEVAPGQILARPAG
jgi:hypothetical protein